MKKKYLLFIKVFSSAWLLIFPLQLSQSCGPNLFPDEGRFCVFRQDLGQQAAWTPFFYTQYRANSILPDPQGVDKKRNVGEWQKITGQTLSLKDIEEAVYQASVDDFLYGYRTGKWGEFSENSFVQWLIKPENKPYLDYLALAKENEFFQLSNASSVWELEEESPEKSISSEKHILALYEALSKSKSPFLQQRYAFLLIRSGQQVEANYRQYLQNSSSILGDWGLIHLASAELEKGDDLAAHYTLLKAFDRCEEKKCRAFQLMDKEVLRKISHKTQDKHIQALIEVILCLNNPSPTLSTYEKIYKLEPNCKYFPLLLQREIHKLEDWILSPEILYFQTPIRNVPEKFYTYSPQKVVSYYEKNKAKDLAYLVKVRDFMVAHPHLLSDTHRNLAIAHLYCIEKKYTEAQAFLEKVPSTVKGNAAVQRNIALIFITAQTQDITQKPTQQKLYQYLTALAQASPVLSSYHEENSFFYNENYEGKGENEDDIDEIYLYLSRCFQQKNDAVTAGLLYQKSSVLKNEYDGYSWGSDVDETEYYYHFIQYWDRYANPEDIDKLLILKEKKQKTQFEAYISPKKWASHHALLELKGTLEFRAGNFVAANQTFLKLPQDYWETKYEFRNYLSARHAAYNPLMPTEYEMDYPKISNSKQRIAGEIVALLKEGESPQCSTRSQIYYQLGNAFFNTTFYGNNWMMCSYGKSQAEFYQDEDNYRFAYFDFLPNQEKYADIHYGCARAIAYFQQAVAANTDREAVAKSLFMLHFCEKQRKEWLQTKTKRTRYDYDAPPVSSRDEYLKRFKSQYKNTRAYELISITCPDA